MRFCRLLGRSEGLGRKNRIFWRLRLSCMISAFTKRSASTALPAGSGRSWRGRRSPRRCSAQAGASAAQAEKIAWLIAHHHSFDAFEDLAFRILLEADFLVNAYESALPPRPVERRGERVFRTETGRSFLQKMYLESRISRKSA